MKILCLDTSRNLQSAALYDSAEQKVLASFCESENEPRRQGKSSKYLPQLVEMMQALGLEAKDVDLIALSTGPGSFTGIRTAMTVAKTMASGLDIKILPINNFELIRFEQSLDDSVFLSAGRSDFFVSLDHEYDNPETNFFMNAEDIAERFGEVQANEFQEKNISLLIARYCEERFQDSQLKASEQIHPYYLREPSVGKIHPKAIIK